MTFSSLYWASWAITDAGKKRLLNEDAFLNHPKRRIWSIADGMGGHNAGEIASQCIVESLDALRLKKNLELSIAHVANCLQTVNSQLRDLAEQSQNQNLIASTVAVLLAHKERYAVLWAGDSRVYRLRHCQLQQLTQDHCPDSECDDEWDKHALKTVNEITRAVGADEFLELDGEIGELCEGDIFLVCSDGLNQELSHHEIEQILLTHPPEKCVEILMALALQRNARDNVSIILAMPVINPKIKK